MANRSKFYQSRDVRNRRSPEQFFNVSPLYLMTGPPQDDSSPSPIPPGFTAFLSPYWSPFLYPHLESPAVEKPLSPEKLEQNFKDYVAKLIKTSEDPDKNQTILSCLSQVADYFVHSLAPDFSWDCGSSFVRAFGSYGLGLVSARSDVDAVLMAPHFVTREMFFHRFLDLLMKQENVKDVCPIENTFVPVIKFMYYGVEIDLTFVRLGEKYSSVPDEATLLSESVLEGMDEKSKKSHNGWRVCRYLLNYVPDQEVFRTLLAFVKHWAVCRMIYSNLLGYLGGVSWAILAAYICKKYEGESVLEHLMGFFREFYNWNWRYPVNINQKENPLGSFQRGPGEDYAMPIITPCIPYQISSYNITYTTLNTIRTEMRRALSLLETPLSSPYTWNEIQEERDPFTDYESYLTVLISARTDSDLRRWRGLVESRLRYFLLALEAVDGVNRVQIIPKGFTAKKLDEPSVGAEDVHCIWAIGFDHSRGFPEAGQPVRDFQDRVLSPMMAKEGMFNGQRVIFKGLRRSRLLEWLGR